MCYGKSNEINIHERKLNFKENITRSKQILTGKNRARFLKSCVGRNVMYAYPVCRVNVVSAQLPLTGALSHNISLYEVI